MAQVEQPANLDRWHDPGSRLLTIILMRCGLRVGYATKVALDCVVRDGDGTPYLRYANRKMKREALVPIDEEVEQAITGQQQRILRRWPDGSPWLFPAPKMNPDGHKPLSTHSYRGQLRDWLDRCDVQKSCPHANACLTCLMFVTTPEFLPQHREHRQQVLQIISAAEARGQRRLAEMNQQVLGNLDNIITALEADPDENEAADAC